eukprot:CFRG7449T1
MAKVLLSFVLGASSAGGVGYFFLREDILASNRFVSKRVVEMKNMVTELETTMNGLEKLKQEVADLKKQSVTHTELSSYKAENEKKMDELETSVIMHKANVWETQQSIFKALESQS